MYLPVPDTTPTRHRERARYDRATVHAILDEALVCHISFVADGRPMVLPMLLARIGDRLYLHGSTGSRPTLRATTARGLRMCVGVTLIDGLVLARSAFHHSAAYRSVIIHGVARLVHGSEKDSALAAIVDRVGGMPGRAADCRPPNERELAATAVLALDLVEVSAKVRGGNVQDEPEDLTLPHWAGFVPITTMYGEPRPADHFAAVQPLPPYLARSRPV